jgi:hypothetical protein
MSAILAYIIIIGLIIAFNPILINLLIFGTLLIQTEIIKISKYIPINYIFTIIAVLPKIYMNLFLDKIKQNRLIILWLILSLTISVLVVRFSFILPIKMNRKLKFKLASINLQVTECILFLLK